jgi:hypothetical protein
MVTSIVSLSVCAVYGMCLGYALITIRASKSRYALWFVRVRVHACMHACMCVCVCVYTYIHTNINTYIHTYTHWCDVEPSVTVTVTVAVAVPDNLLRYEVSERPRPHEHGCARLNMCNTYKCSLTMHATVMSSLLNIYAGASLLNVLVMPSLVNMHVMTSLCYGIFA